MPRLRVPRRLAWGFLIMVAAFPARAAGETSRDVEAAQAMIAALQAQVAELSARLGRLEEAKAPVDVQEYVRPVVESTLAERDHWSDRIRIKGDVRYRHEAFNREDRRERHRQRVRARLGLTGQVSESIEAGFALASGGSDPISTNQTLGDGFSSKGVVLDLAYATWKTPMQGVAVRAGKFKNPFVRVGGTGLVWDGDLNPEGAAVTYEGDVLFATLMGNWLDESSGDDDSFLVGAQMGARFDVGSDAQWMIGAGYYNHIDVRGETPFFDGDPRGNRVDFRGDYLSGFEVIEVFTEYAIDLGEQSLALYGDFVHNTAADDFDTGFALGGEVEAANGLTFGYEYRDVEADAVLGLFTDSDFIGGGTDGRGHILQLAYPLSKRIGLAGTLFLNDRGVDLGSDENFKRLMLDVSFKY